jgi:hypothetical protein
VSSSIPTTKAGHIPSAHNITITTKDFGQAADYNIPIRQDIHVEEISNGFIDHHAKVIRVCQVADTLEVWRSQKGVSRKFGEERGKTLAALESFLQVIQLF